MKYILLCLLLAGCYQNSLEMEKLSDDVLKHKEGIDIEIKPVKAQ